MKTLNVGDAVEWNPNLSNVSLFPTLKKHVPKKKDGTIVNDVFLVVMAKREVLEKWGSEVVKKLQVQVDEVPGVWLSAALFTLCSEEIQSLVRALPSDSA